MARRITTWRGLRFKGGRFWLYMLALIYGGDNIYHWRMMMQLERKWQALRTGVGHGD